MRYRRLDGNGDFSFGHGLGDYHIDSAEAVMQSILTRLRLFAGEWFLDTSEGTPYATKVLGTGTKSLYDLAIQARVLGTQGVTGIKTYSSEVNGRALKVSMTVSISTALSPEDTTSTFAFLIDDTGNILYVPASYIVVEA